MQQKILKKMFYFLLCSISIFLYGCATSGLIAQGKGEDINISSPETLSIVLPNDNKIKNLDSFIHPMNYQKILNVSYYKGNIARRDLIKIKRLNNDTLSIERRTDNGSSGSGIIYTIKYNIIKKNDYYIIKYIPLRYRTYQEGLILPFAVPNFDQEAALNFLAHQALYYQIEINSPYNSESIYANFERLANKVQLSKGEKDPITGKIFKRKFFIEQNGEKIFFYLKVYPYRNGSKSIFYLTIPGYYTSKNTVDYRVILHQVIGMITEIVNS